ncbi:unnamed protein product [Polarella glacialis]|uniref:Uncharacterized protein n=1 Tax=Polarella glacialis TaxID=89957 RepID=A0A813HNY4_POLGL|nr:unnamed protein product [Polarella glacialis]
MSSNGPARLWMLAKTKTHFCPGIRVRGRLWSLLVVGLTAPLWPLNFALLFTSQDLGLCDGSSQGIFLLQAIFNSVAASLVVPAAAYVSARARSPHMLEVAVYLRVLWLSDTSLSYRSIADASALNGAPTVLPALVAAFIGISASIASIVLLYSLQLHLVQGLQHKFLDNLGAELLRRISVRVFPAVCSLYVPLLMYVMTARPSDDHVIRKVIGPISWLALGLEVTQISVSRRAFRRVRVLLDQAKTEGTNAEALNMLRRQDRRLLGSFTTMIAVHAVFSFLQGTLWPLPTTFRTLVLTSDAPSSCPLLLAVDGSSYMAVLRVVLGAIALYFSGALSGALERGEAVFLREEERQLKRTTSSEAYAPPCQVSGWQEKVEEMGMRGISLSALLHFYRGLGSRHMLHFDPAKSTTNDVVRQAIIPLSSSTMQCLASTMMDGVLTRPSRMVTHNWGNLFRDLFAAVVADALGESSYESLGCLIDQDLDQIEHWLHRANALSTTYWICAFCVNQHAGICGYLGGHERDNVTQQSFLACSCNAQKFLNDAEPLSSHGSSVRCEMNKFDSMMHWLAATDTSFYQVVAVDAGFELFGRAWCVAELAEAHSIGMCQQLKVVSAAALEENAHKLRDLKVQEMRASRQEDVDEILAKIPDHETFNQQLHDMIFYSVISGWTDLDEQQKLDKAAHIARWQLVPIRSPLKPAGENNIISI